MDAQGGRSCNSAQRIIMVYRLTLNARLDVPMSQRGREKGARCAFDLGNDGARTVLHVTTFPAAPRSSWGKTNRGRSEEEEGEARQGWHLTI